MAVMSMCRMREERYMSYRTGLIFIREYWVVVNRPGTLEI
jgi:hypothetical protein